MTNSSVNRDDLILVSIDAHVMTIAFNREEKKNAINVAMYRALTSALNTAVADASIRVILLAGSDGCFTSGNDLADFASASDLLPVDNPIVEFMKTLSQCPKPVVVAVDGMAVGIGVIIDNPACHNPFRRINHGCHPTSLTALKQSASLLKDGTFSLRKGPDVLGFQQGQHFHEDMSGGHRITQC